MNAPITYSGGCVCGQVRYTSAVPPAFSAHCHCRDCQRSSGGAMSTVSAFPRDALQVTGVTKSYRYVGGSGQGLFRHWCPDCGAPLMSDAESLPQMLLVRSASLDDPAWVKPQMHIFYSQAQPWDVPNDDLPRFDGARPRPAT